MCGRFAIPSEAAVSKILIIDRWNWHWAEPRYNVAPTTNVPIVVKADDALVELNGARWGLIPHWWKKDAPPSLTFNARSEEAAVKPTWRHSIRKLRCLMPVRGWYGGTKMNKSGAILAERSSSPTSSLHLTQKSSLLPGFGSSGMDIGRQPSPCGPRQGLP